MSDEIEKFEVEKIDSIFDLELFKSQLEHLQERLKAHPEEREQVAAMIAEVQDMLNGLEEM